MCLKLFEKKCINSFELDPVCYLSTPGYSSDTRLRFTDIHLKLISGIEKYHFIENTVRGGISMICKGCAEANNKFLKSYNITYTYNTNILTIHILSILTLQN